MKNPFDESFSDFFVAAPTAGFSASLGGGPAPVLGAPIAVPDEEREAEAAFAASGNGGPGSVVTVTGATSAGLTINLVFDAAAMAAPQSFRDGITAAMQMICAVVTDHVTLNLQIDYSGTGKGAFGGPSGGNYFSYSTVRADLVNNATPGDTTFNSLPTGSTIAAQSSVAVWYSQEKLWGLISPTGTEIDGSASFATDISPSLLVGVALHELTHAMGRVPYAGSTGQPDIFDFYRFTSAGNNLINGNSTAPAAYFSLNNGASKIADYGQTSDPSDFLNSGVQGSTDPFNEFYSGSTQQQLTALDLKQLDALGFHIATADTQAPSLLSDHPLSILSGTTQTISTSLLSANDNASSAAQLHYTITAAPSDGTLLLSGSATSSFTQADINNGLVSYHETAGFVTSDRFSFTVADAAGNTMPASSFQINIEPVFSGNRSDYHVSYDDVAKSFNVTDQRQGSPDGTHALNNSAQFQFADGVSVYSYDANGTLVSETFNNINGTHWVNTFDTAGNQTWVWSINLYDAQGSLISQSGLNHDGTHWLTLDDINNQYGWTSATIHFDADWNETSISGTNDDGSHSLTMADIAAAYDSATWLAQPFDTILNQAGAAVGTIESNGATALVQTGNNYFLNPVAGGVGPELKYGGTAFTAGSTFGAWAPIGAEAISGGYEVAFKINADTYTVWDTDTNGSITTNVLATTTGSSTALESLEPSFRQDLNGDGTIGLPAQTSPSAQIASAAAAAQGAPSFGGGDSFAFRSDLGSFSGNVPPSAVSLAAGEVLKLMTAFVAHVDVAEVHDLGSVLFGAVHGAVFDPLHGFIIH